MLELLKQRRIWAGIFAAVAFILPLFGKTFNFDVNAATDYAINLVGAVSTVVSGVLAVWSYFKPKNVPQA